MTVLPLIISAGEYISSAAPAIALQQFGERVHIALAEVINTLSRGRFNYEPEFTGKNKEQLEFLKSKLKTYTDAQVENPLKQFINSATYHRCIRPLSLVESRVYRELQRENRRLTAWDDDEVPY